PSVAPRRAQTPDVERPPSPYTTLFRSQPQTHRPTHRRDRTRVRRCAVGGGHGPDPGHRMNPHEGVEVDLFGDPIEPPPPGEATRGRRGALTAAQWRTWLDDQVLVERYLATIHWRGEDACAYWLGTISSTGHAKLRVGSYTDDTRRVVTAHLLGYQLAHGVLEDSLGDVVIGH